MTGLINLCRNRANVEKLTDLINISLPQLMQTMWYFTAEKIQIVTQVYQLQNLEIELPAQEHLYDSKVDETKAVGTSVLSSQNISTPSLVVA